MEAESEPATEIEFSPRIVGPFDAYPLPSQREAVVEASLGRQAETETHTTQVASTSRAQQEFFTSRPIVLHPKIISKIDE